VLHTELRFDDPHDVLAPQRADAILRSGACVEPGLERDFLLRRELGSLAWLFTGDQRVDAVASVATHPLVDEAG
jgi:hypothetical protein